MNKFKCNFISEFLFIKLFGAVILTFISSPVISWSALGHELTARIAYELMTPDTRLEVDKILNGESFESVSTWADRIKIDRKETEYFHYINFIATKTALTGKPETTSPKNVVSGIVLYKDILQRSNASSQEKKEALSFLIHFFGDIHQPLHNSLDGTNGGNDIKVKFFNEETNLHKVWDNLLLKQAGFSKEEYFQNLMNMCKDFDQNSIRNENYMDWALESNQIALTKGYDITPDHVLGKTYYENNIPVINQRLVTGGIHLAQMLNKVFDKKYQEVTADNLLSGNHDQTSILSMLFQYLATDSLSMALIKFERLLSPNTSKNQTQ
ncbi:MAG: S1/P1 nuclease [Candidatus Riflebacteria bacterium]|nr:S1/P1 nuclease [Candidatus Riflebacteria bacterium]